MLGKKFDWFLTERNIYQHHATQPNDLMFLILDLESGSTQRLQ